MYDPLGRIIETGTVVGSTTIAYDQRERLITDPLGNTKKLYDDAFGRLTGVDEINDGSNYATRYAYDTNNNMSTSSDALGNVRYLTFNSLSERTRAEDLHAQGDGTYGIWTYGYD